MTSHSEQVPSETRDMWMLARDDDGHWYVIPVLMEEEFGEWVNKTCQGMNPNTPAWARQVGGSPSLVHFPDGWSIQ